MAKLTRYNKDCYQVVDDAGNVMFLALALSNGKWAPYDIDDKRVGDISFRSAASTFLWLKTNGYVPAGGPDGKQ